MTDKRESYRQLLQQAQSLFAGEREKIANAVRKGEKLMRDSVICARCGG